MWCLCSKKRKVRAQKKEEEEQVLNEDMATLERLGDSLLGRVDWNDSFTGNDQEQLILKEVDLEGCIPIREGTIIPCNNFFEENQESDQAIIEK